MKEAKARALYKKARHHLVGGVCSSTRLNRALGRPFFASRGEGAHVWDIDGNEYIDLCMSHGASLLGHNHPSIREAVEKAKGMGFLCSFETKFHHQLADLICETVPCAEAVRFTNSGTEATMHALRVCRAFTGKDKVLRFEGHFHGYHDYLYIGGHPPEKHLQDPLPYRESSGIPEDMARFVISIPFNDMVILKKTLKKYQRQICCLILEPINYNSGCIVPARDYMQEMRRITQKYGVLLFYDEIQSSFKKCLGGAQEYFGVKPDICTIGKALGGGLPLSAFCGRSEIMNRLKPQGDVEHSGTFNAHLVSVLAGLAFMKEIRKKGFYERLENLGEYFYKKFKEIIAETGSAANIQYHGPRFGLFFGVKNKVINYRQTLKHDRQMMLKFIRECIQNGVYFHDYGGACAHHGFSIVHTYQDLDMALAGIRKSLDKIKKKNV